MNEPLVFTISDLRSILEPDLGPLRMLMIHPPTHSSGKPRWSGVTEDAEVVDGEIEITMTARDDGTFVVTPSVTLQGASGRMLAMPRSSQQERPA